MYRAVIVDDELKICRLIECLGHWEQYQIEVLECCQDGETAWESILREKPDIVLTDIRMPIYDGLEIIRRARKEAMDTAFIVVSGYKEFEYARQALQYGVVDFLVKPVNEEALNTALKKAVDSICAARQSERAQDILQNNEKREKEQLLLKMVSREEDDSVGDNLQEALSLFEKDIFQTVLIKTNKVELNKKDSKLSESILRFVEEALGEIETIAVAKDEGIYILINYKKEDTLQIKNGLYDILKRTKWESGIYGNFDVTIGVGLPVDHISKMKVSIDTAQKAWRQRICRNDREVIQYEKLPVADDLCNSYLRPEEWKELKHAVECCDVNCIKNILCTMESYVGRYGNVNVTALFEETQKIVYLIEKMVCAEEREAHKQTEYVVEEMQLSNTISDFFLRLNHFSVTQMQKYYEEKMMAKKTPIVEAKRLLAQNYMREISMEEMAEQVNLSPAYFSKLFKSVEGKNYIEYLTELRVERAKELLKTTGNPIKAIALEVGYPNEKYFSKLFKKVVGIKPGEYRKLH